MKNKVLIIASVFGLVFGLFGVQALRPSVASARDGGRAEIKDSVSNDERDQEESKDINDDNGDNGEEYSDQVEKVADKLQEVSNKRNDIDDELDDIIGEMASSSEDASKAIDDLDKENSVKKFFFGPDFKSLGELRSTLVTTQNHIDRLTKAQARVTSPTVKATLESQIVELRNIASSTQEFVSTHESGFSIFGWFVKLFSK